MKLLKWRPIGKTKSTPQKGPPIGLFSSSFLPHLCIDVVTPAWLRMIKHEMACNILYAKYQLFKVNMSLSVYSQRDKGVHTRHPTQIASHQRSNDRLISVVDVDIVPKNPYQPLPLSILA